MRAILVPGNADGGSQRKTFGTVKRVANNQAMHWSTASDVFEMDNRPAVPSDGQRYLDKRDALHVPKRKIDRLARMFRDNQIGWRFIHDNHLMYWLYLGCDPVELLDALPVSFLYELRDWAFDLPETEADQESRVSIGNPPELSLERCVTIKNWFRARFGDDLAETS